MLSGRWLAVSLFAVSYCICYSGICRWTPWARAWAYKVVICSFGSSSYKGRYTIFLVREKRKMAIRCRNQLPSPTRGPWAAHSLGWKPAENPRYTAKREILLYPTISSFHFSNGIYLTTLILGRHCPIGRSAQRTHWYNSPGNDQSSSVWVVKRNWINSLEPQTKC